MSGTPRDPADYAAFDAELSGRAFEGRLLGRLLHWLRPYRGMVVTSVIAVLAASYFAVLMPIVVARVVIDGMLVAEQSVALPDLHQDLANFLLTEVGLSLSSNFPLIFCTPAGNKLFPLLIAFNAPLSIIISPFGAIDPIIHCFLASSFEIFGKNHVHF